MHPPKYIYLFFCFFFFPVKNIAMLIYLYKNTFFFLSPSSLFSLPDLHIYIL
jgi:hypothetical protein